MHIWFYLLPCIWALVESFSGEGLRMLSYLLWAAGWRSHTDIFTIKLWENHSTSFPPWKLQQKFRSMDLVNPANCQSYRIKFWVNRISTSFDIFSHSWVKQSIKYPKQLKEGEPLEPERKLFKVYQSLNLQQSIQYGYGSK